MNKKGDIITVKRNNKLFEAINLPKVLNCNPQSLYNKKEEFIALMEQKEIDIAFISESWERNNWPLSELLEDLSTAARWAISARHSSCRLTVRKMVLILLRRVFKVKKQKQRNAR